jgi:hypothetical protein
MKPTICPHCGEPILKGEPVMPIGKDQYHHECGFRLAAGSVGHIQKRCSCYGGTEDDPPGLSIREAAKAALAAYLNKTGTGKAAKATL